MANPQCWEVITIRQERKQIVATRCGDAGRVSNQNIYYSRAGVGHVRSQQVATFPLTPPVTPRDIVNGKPTKLRHRRE